MTKAKRQQAIELAAEMVVGAMLEAVAVGGSTLPLISTTFARVGCKDDLFILELSKEVNGLIDKGRDAKTKLEALCPNGVVPND